MLGRSAVLLPLLAALSALILLAPLLCGAKLSLLRRDVSGIVDDCSCRAEDVGLENDDHMHDLLERLVSTTFFRTFKVDLKTECSLWAQNYMCGAAGGCNVCECTENEIPVPWKTERTDPIDRSIIPEVRHWKDARSNMWIESKLSDSDMTYVNLRINPEGNTGYSGSEARKVWAAIHENCPQGSLDDMCLEERVLIRLLSGFHMSITTHVALNFYNVTLEDSEGNAVGSEWRPNLDMFERAIKPHEDRIKNVYFTYLFLLRAVAKSAPLLQRFDFNTGNPSEDKHTALLVEELLGSSLLCNPTFNDSVLISENANLMARSRVHNIFRNISSIMNCVGCEKCKMWSKLQVLGLSTAVKIIMSDEEVQDLDLQRNEIIALMNTLRQMSDSIEGIRRMTEMQRMGLVSTITSAVLFLISILVPVVLFLKCTRRAHHRAPFSSAPASSTPAAPDGQGNGGEPHEEDKKNR